MLPRVAVESYGGDQRSLQMVHSSSSVLQEVSGSFSLFEVRTLYTTTTRLLQRSPILASTLSKFFSFPQWPHP